MTSPRRLLSTLSRLLAVSAVLLGVVAINVPAAEPATAVTYTDEQNVLFKALDDCLARFDSLLATDTDVEHQALIGAYLNGFHVHPPAIKEDDALLQLLTGVFWPNGFKDRAAALHKGPFDQQKYDELRMDIDVQYQRLTMFLAPPRTPPRPKGPVVPEVALNRLDPSPADKAEVKAALDALDFKVKRLEEKTSALPAGPARDAHTARIKTIRTGRAELAANFTKARWDALVTQVELGQR
jgi:hypothetical protein